MSETQQTVRITGDLSDVNSKLEEGIKHLRAYGQQLDVNSQIAVNAFRAEAAALRERSQGWAVAAETQDKLTQTVRQFENQVESSSRRSAQGFDSMARGLMYVASTGNLAGRGMATVVNAASNIAFAFGPEGKILAGVAITGLAIYEMFDRSEKKAEALRKKVDEVINSMDPRRIAEAGRFIGEQLKEAESKFHTEAFENPLVAFFMPKHIRELQSQQGTMDAAEGRARKQIELTEQYKTLTEQLSNAREVALKKEGELQRASMAGDAVAGAALISLVDKARGAVASADAQVRAFLNSSTPYGTIGDLLKLNVDKDLADLNAQAAEFAARERDLTDQDNTMKAQTRFDRGMEAISKSIERKTLENPFVAAALGVPLTKDAAAKYAQQMDESAHLMALSGFGGPSTLAGLSGAQFDQLWETLRGALSRMPKPPRRQLAPGEQFILPQGYDPNSKESVTGKSGVSDLTQGMADFSKGFDTPIDKFKVMEQAGKTAYESLSAGAKTAIDQIIEHHKLAIGPIKKALGEPIVSFLEALAIRKYAEAVADIFTAPQKIAADLAGAAAATAGAIAVGSLMGTGASGGGSTASSGAAAGGIGSGQKNAPAALGRGRDTGGTMQLEVLVTQKSEDGRTLAQNRQRFQRLDDRNQPARLVL